MLKAAIEKIVSLAAPTVINVDGRTFSNGEFEEVRTLKFYPKYLPLSGLDSVVKMTREEAVPTYSDQKIYLQVSGYNTVSVFTEYDEEKRRAEATAPARGLLLSIQSDARACARALLVFLFYSAFLAVSTRAAKPAWSWMAISLSILRFSSMPAFFRPFMKLE